MGFGSMLKDYLDYNKISQTDFAMRLGISTKHLNEVLNGNASFSIEMMHAVSLLTDIDVNLIFYAENKRKMKNYLNSKFESDKDIKKFFDSFYLKEMEENNWIRLKDKESNEQKALDLLEFLNVKDFDSFNPYLNQKVLYKKKDDANLKKVYLWLKHCDKKLLEQTVGNYSNDNINLLINDLKKFRNQKFNELKLIKLFNKYGIYLIIEDALKGTKIRGAMSVKGLNPIIYMTKYNKEKASFYYVLYHELGHVKSDYNVAKSKIIIEDDIDKEDKCDQFALEQMIPNDIWKEILANYNNKDNICISNNIPLCFLYSRLAYEGKITYLSKEYSSHREKI